MIRNDDDGDDDRAERWYGGWLGTYKLAEQSVILLCTQERLMLKIRGEIDQDGQLHK